MIELLIEVDCILILTYSIGVSDPDDPLKTTDQTRRLGLIVRIILLYIISLILSAKKGKKSRQFGLRIPFNDILMM